jgi:hypothetical protein
MLRAIIATTLLIMTCDVAIACPQPYRSAEFNSIENAYWFLLLALLAVNIVLAFYVSRFFWLSTIVALPLGYWTVFKYAMCSAEIAVLQAGIAEACWVLACLMIATWILSRMA